MLRTALRLRSTTLVAAAALLAAACNFGAYQGPPGSASSPYTDEDAGIGYQLDLAGEDLASGTVLPGHYHPQGYVAAEIHGRDLKLQVQDCRTCHAADLTGGVVGAGGGMTAPPSCDSCHKAGWRSDCTFCHGTPGGAGSPPRDLDGQMDARKISFPAHGAHISGRIAPAFDCVQCHRKPTDVLTPYHAFDASPRRGENNLSAGLSSQGLYDPVLGQCTNLYCHGNGRASNGTVAKLAAGPLACSSCHPDITTSARWTQMSGDHRRHLNKADINCTHCHANTVATQPSTISGIAQHVNGKPDVVFGPDSGNMVYAAATKRCTGTCHGENHNETW